MLKDYKKNGVRFQLIYEYRSINVKLNFKYYMRHGIEHILIDKIEFIIIICVDKILICDD